MYYVKGALAGGICCSITHSALCPVDVVKTRIQLDPIKYRNGLLGTARQIIAEEGAVALSSGFGATAAGYFVQGWFKFGGVEFFKVQFAKNLGERKAWDNRTSIYLASPPWLNSLLIFSCAPSRLSALSPCPTHLSPRVLLEESSTL